MITLRVVAAAIVSAYASNSLAVPVPNDWRCDTGKAPHIIKDVPTKEDGKIVLAVYHRGIAPSPSDYTLALMRGGPTGFYVKGHLHGVRRQRTGNSIYNIGGAVEDKNGYRVAFIPVINQTLSSHLKYDAHLHCGIQYTFPKDEADNIRASLRQGKLVMVGDLSRKRDDPATSIGGTALKAYRDYMKGAKDYKRILKDLNHNVIH